MTLKSESMVKIQFVQVWPKCWCIWINKILKFVEIIFAFFSSNSCPTDSPSRSFVEVDCDYTAWLPWHGESDINTNTGRHTWPCCPYFLVLVNLLFSVVFRSRNTLKLACNLSLHKRQNVRTTLKSNRFTVLLLLPPSTNSTLVMLLLAMLETGDVIQPLCEAIR